MQTLTLMTTHARQHSKLVLVVDDDPALARMLRLTLRDRGYGVSVAHDGVDALAQVEDLHPDAIVLDLEMPTMSGREVIEELRARGHEIPVLLISAYGARAASRELHPDGCLDKPFDPETFVDRVSRLV